MDEEDENSMSPPKAFAPRKVSKRRSTTTTTSEESSPEPKRPRPGAFGGISSSEANLLEAVSESSMPGSSERKSDSYAFRVAQQPHELQNWDHQYSSNSNFQMADERDGRRQVVEQMDDSDGDELPQAVPPAMNVLPQALPPEMNVLPQALPPEMNVLPQALPPEINVVPQGLPPGVNWLPRIVPQEEEMLPRVRVIREIPPDLNEVPLDAQWRVRVGERRPAYRGSCIDEYSENSLAKCARCHKLLKSKWAVTCEANDQHVYCIECMVQYYDSRPQPHHCPSGERCNAYRINFPWQSSSEHIRQVNLAWVQGR